MRLFRTITIAMGATLLLGTVLAESAAAAPAQHRYRIVDLGTLGGDYSDASAVNAHGDVTGQSSDAKGVLHPFKWHNGKMINLGALDPSAPYGYGAAINDRGWVVGSADVAGGTAMHAFLWRDGKMTDLGTLGGRFSGAAAVNDRGQIVGRSETASGQWHAFLWQNGQMTDLGLDLATGINNRGQVVGATPQGTKYQAYRWRNGTLTNLGDLGSGFSQATAVNIRGHVVGISSVAGESHAFLYRTSMVDLGTLGGLTSEARAINDRDEVLGVSESATGQHAFLWRGGKMTDLSTRGIPVNATVRDLNNRGQIAGQYFVGPFLHAALFV
jgi:probable HAF family extracellular repeat protein